MRLHFFKLDGAGNDFVGIDWRGRTPLDEQQAAQVARILCNRHHGVGADGILLIEDARPGDAVDFTMRYRNADGSIGEMCGNGARCIATFAHHLGAAPASMRFQTGAGIHRAQVLPEGQIRVDFPDVPVLPQRLSLTGPLQIGREVDFLLVGVPHAVVWVEDLDQVDVETAGREIRHDPALGPKGANVNFAEAKGDAIHVRTYERGVEGETQACGTGSVATSCCIAHRRGVADYSEINIIPTSTIPLRIGLRPTGSGFSRVSLAGPAAIRFAGTCELSAESGIIRLAE